MSKYDKYKISNQQSLPSDRWNQYKIPNQENQSNAELLSKAFASGILSNADTPQNIAAIGLNPEYGIIGQGRKLYNQVTGKPHQVLEAPNFITSLPLASSKIKNTIKDYGGIDLEPKPTTAGQRIASNAAEFAGAMVNPTSFVTKGGGLISNFLGSGKNLAKDAALGGAIGTASGALQEGDINPLVANLTAAAAVPLVSAGGKNLLNKFSKEHRNTKAKQKVKKAFTNQIGEENLPTALDNIKKYNKRKKPIDLELTTPEVAQDIGLSRFSRTQSNSPQLAKKFVQNEAKLKEALESIGTTGLPESVKGEAIRNPFFEKFNKKVARRNDITKPLYDELAAIEEGLDPSMAKSLLDKEISVSSPGNKAPLERYRKNLVKNDVDPLIIGQIKEIEDSLINIDKNYKDINPNALQQLKAPLEQELLELKASINPRPIQIENTIQELGDKVNAFSRNGENNAARLYGNIKKAYEGDLAKNPKGLKHRTEYKRLSKPINEIEKSSLLNNFVKKNTDISKPEGFTVSSEKLPALIVGADLQNTKTLINKAKGNKELLDLVKGSYIDKLIETSTNKGSGNFSYPKASAFLDNKYNKEKLKVIFNSKERKALDQYLDALKRRSKVENAGKVSGSDTHQKFKIENEINEDLKGLSTLFEKGLLKASGTGAIGEIATNTAKKFATKLNPYQSILDDALANPNSFRKLMTDQHRTKALSDFYNPIPGLIVGGNLGMRRN